MHDELQLLRNLKLKVKNKIQFFNELWFRFINI